MTSALASFDQCCIVVDKQQPQYTAVRQLASNGKALSSANLDGFDEIALSDEDGNPPVIHPYTKRFSEELGPVADAPLQDAGPWRRYLL
ncbi:hypothetical protein [Actinomadura viridis]|uniref:Uncharacterized protein n=1 Tax=Actinomadura viridis TaxID=58110 RepID=A0A931GU59_9ACTN|nr:hypothetical protein [Actinomadura viridis]MBG6092809.1 hypothetical protein [Actinomadura viridis]